MTPFSSELQSSGHNTPVGGLHELRSYGKPGAVVYLADCVELMRLIPAGGVEVVFEDPPYRL